MDLEDRIKNKRLVGGVKDEDPVPIVNAILKLIFFVQIYVQMN